MFLLNSSPYHWWILGHSHLLGVIWCTLHEQHHGPCLNDYWLWKIYLGGRETLWLRYQHGVGLGSTDWDSACLLFLGTSWKNIFNHGWISLMLMMVFWGIVGVWTLWALSYALMTTSGHALDQDFSNFYGHQNHLQGLLKHTLLQQPLSQQQFLFSGLGWWMIIRTFEKDSSSLDSNGGELYFCTSQNIFLV